MTPDQLLTVLLTFTLADENMTKVCQQGCVQMVAKILVSECALEQYLKGRSKGLI